MRRIAWGLCVVVVLCGALAASAEAKGVKPVITGLAASPSTVAPGGSTNVVASVSEATTCKLSANKAVPGLPVTFSCESGGVSREVTMPGNTGKKEASYKLALEATGAGGKAKGKVTIDVGTAPLKGPPLERVSAGDSHTCSLLPSGHIECWGGNHWGQLGDGATTNADAPVEVESITTATQVSASSARTCALLSSGEIACWGDDGSGGLGNGTAWSTLPAEVLGIP
ncbi:MAG TPA: hypothetical protein VMB91_01640 [Solirubrobacteraceae bacterium]|nr:hypothetical protein [Solirubrobacteraceae bacterium]